MKLVHSNVIHEPESQSFELDGSDVFTPVYKSQSKKVKDYHNGVSVDLKRNEKESEDCMTTPKVEFNDRVIDCKTDYEAQVKDVVKDICVDEGVPTKGKFLFEISVEEKAYNSFPCNEDKETKKDNIGIDVINLPRTGKFDQVLANHDQSKDLICKDKVVIQTLSGNANEENLPGDKALLQELGKQEPWSSDDVDEQVSHEPESHSQSIESESVVDEAVLTSPTLALAVVESNCDTMLPEKGSIIYMLNPPVLGALCGKDECHQDGGCKCKDTHDTSEPVDEKLYDEVISRQIHNSLNEPSFSAVDHGSRHISYSGHVPYSGSISLRSDSSTTSTRSFAFPVLPSEWNSSPVRMAKADKSNYRKHRSWREGLLCCKF
ncbi:hypothetical protein Lal_00025557 [Lupinus albus]|uniref:Uncharacterized protein n=1 Tax=Lupinus albus TaxID=3870 RepID=A0A6A5NZ30_LUPAL|nr:hypothetical protein Lalb_Chr10g0099151 [Lupinus albus]KAF1890224.1 hypothetical protein Lal_00025557 [Lupinus albus]